MTTKSFDCVEMKCQGQRRLHELLKDMTPQQRIEWWQQRNEAFMRTQDRLRAQRQSGPAAPVSNG